MSAHGLWRDLELERLTPAVRVDVTSIVDAVGAGYHGTVVESFERVSGSEGQESTDEEESGGEEAHFERRQGAY